MNSVRIGDSVAVARIANSSLTIQNRLDQARNEKFVVRTKVLTTNLLIYQFKVEKILGNQTEITTT